MRATIYMGMSLDGFVARPDDKLDFLGAPPDGEAGGDDSFPKFLATVDVLVMGRRTFDVVLPFDPWPYGNTPVVVLSRTLTTATLPAGTPPTVRVMAGEPAEVLRILEGEGVRHAYVDGAMTARDFLIAGLITDLVVTHVPVLIGAGISPWGPLPSDVHLKLVATRPFMGQAVQSRYTVVPGS